MLRQLLIILLSLSLLSAATLLSACSPSPESKVAGDYSIDKQATRADLQNRIDSIENEETKIGAQMMLAMIDTFDWTLTLNEDMTASGTTALMGQTTTATGTWSLDGDAITISMAEPGQSPELARGTVRDDLIILSPPEGNNMDMTLTFRRLQPTN